MYLSELLLSLAFKIAPKTGIKGKKIREHILKYFCIKGLKKEDFIVTRDNEKQEIDKLIYDEKSGNYYFNLTQTKN